MNIKNWRGNDSVLDINPVEKKIEHGGHVAPSPAQISVQLKNHGTAVSGCSFLLNDPRLKFFPLGCREKFQSDPSKRWLRRFFPKRRNSHRQIRSLPLFTHEESCTLRHAHYTY